MYLENLDDLELGFHDETVFGIGGGRLDGGAGLGLLDGVHQTHRLAATAATAARARRLRHRLHQRLERRRLACSETRAQLLTSARVLQYRCGIT